MKKLQAIRLIHVPKKLHKDFITTRDNIIWSEEDETPLYFFRDNLVVYIDELKSNIKMQETEIERHNLKKGHDCFFHIKADKNIIAVTERVLEWMTKEEVDIILFGASQEIH